MKTGIKLIALLWVASITSCSKDKEKEPEPLVNLRADAALGKILTDQTGRTLYYFANDFDGNNSCTGGCATLWPVFYAENLTATNISKDLSINDFKTITTGAGAKQLAYKGRPLYYYAPKVGTANVPEAAGATGGENFNGVWFVAKPDYTVMITNAQLLGHDGKKYTGAYVEGEGKTLYFTDAAGITLYTFRNDKKDKNNFTKSDFSNNGVWPIYEQTLIVVPSSLDKSLFGSIDVFGKKQLTYKGWPLYNFGQDNKVMGSNKGISFPTPGGIWPVPVKDIPAATP